MNAYKKALSVVGFASIFCVVAVASARGMFTRTTPATESAGDSLQSVGTNASSRLPHVRGKTQWRGKQRHLFVEGSADEMGFAHGYLLHAQVIDLIDHFVFATLPKRSFNWIRLAFSLRGHVSPQIRQEADALARGMQAAGGGYSKVLDRNLDGTDILVLNAITDISAVGCSSIAVLNSDEIAAVRNLDWSDAPALLRNQVVIEYHPSDGQAFLSVAFAGYIGCLSCINESGVTSLFNMGYGDGAKGKLSLATRYEPINLRLRDAIEHRDFNGDGISSAADIGDALEQSDPIGSYIVHILQPKSLPGHPARVYEVEGKGISWRVPDVHDLGTHALAATNHLRKRQTPKEGWRYKKIRRQLRAHTGTWTDAQLRSIGASVQLPSVVHRILVHPEARSFEVQLREIDAKFGAKSPRQSYIIAADTPPS